MRERLAVKLAVWLFKAPTLSIESRNLLTVYLLERLGALAIRDTIEISENGLLVNGVPLEYDAALKLREGAKAALQNQALQLVWNQVRYSAFVGSASTGTTPIDLYFFRTAIWNGEQERNWLRVLAGEIAE